MLLLRILSVKSERIFILMKSVVNDISEYNYTGKQKENNKEESGDDEDINMKLKEEGKATNENDENVIKIDLKKMFFINNFPNISH